MPAPTTAPHPTNRLINATSPYLLQHAHNPVDWYEWGAEALERARREDKPIFLSIGYSACHWCHVMERESFENEEIAIVMNANFINIKVDREERPDLDDIYMTATQAFTRSGGWPMSVWLTPDGRPFYAGTYFPPEGAFGRPGFKEVLLFLINSWNDQREKVLQQADGLTNAVRQLAAIAPGGDLPAYDLIPTMADHLAKSFDPVHGGISGGGSNKFPPSMAMDLMLRAYHQSLVEDKPEKNLLELVQLTLDKMAHGGIYDQLGGGFARYSTDEKWLVPHFEKMLYDQALVSDIYLKAYQLTKKPLYARIARETLDYVLADLQDPASGIYSTRDADSEGHEGKFYAWSKKEVVAILGPIDADLFCDYYDVTDDGNWENSNILNIPRPAETLARLHRISTDDLLARLAAARQKLFTAREKRVKPHLDDKVLASWNGLIITSLARASRILSEPRYGDAAARAADFIFDQMMKNGRLLRVWRKGRAHTPAFLEDHAFLIEGLVALYETRFDPKWLQRAEALNAVALAHFADPDAGGFFATADDAEKLIIRSKDSSDSAIPSGNSVQLMNLLKLSVLLDRKDLADEAQRLLRSMGGHLRESPWRSERMLSALDFYHRRPKEIAIIWPPDNPAAADPLILAAWQTYLPNAVIAARPDQTHDDPSRDREGAVRAFSPRQDATKTAHSPTPLPNIPIPLLDNKTLLAGKPAAYLCKNFACQTPVTDPAALIQQLSR